MKLFTQIVKTAVNIVTLPVAVVKDVVTLGGTLTGDNPDHALGETHLAKKLDEIKKDAEEG
jgi:hypothetical protein